MILLQKTRHSVTSKSEEDSGGLRVLTLTSWIPRLKKGKFYIEGDLKEVDTSMKDQRSFESSRYRTSIITRRISARVVATKNKERKKRLYVLEGILAEENNNPWTPHFIMEKFKFGFPHNWEKIVQLWIQIDADNSKNYVNMSLANSSILSTLSNFGNDATQLTSISISTDSSGFIHSRSTNLSTTVHTQANIGPEPDLTMRADLTRSSNDVVEGPAFTPHLDLQEEVEDIITAPDRDADLTKECCLRASLLYQFCDVCMFNDIQINTSDICYSVIVELGDQVRCPARG